MAIEAELADGRILEFPDGTDPSIIQATVKRVLASGQPAPQTTVGGNVKEAVKGFIPGAVGLLETAATGASALLPTDLEKSAREKIESAAGAAKKPFEAAPGYEQSVGRRLGEGLGSILPVAPLGFLGLPGVAAGVGVGLAAGAGEARTRAEQEGATAEQRSKATAAGTVPGAFDTAIDMALAALPGGVGRSLGMVRRALASGGIEGATEAAQAIAQNLIAKGIYKPEQAVLEGAGEEGAYGAGVGALASVLLDMAIPGRTRGAQPPVQPPAKAPPAPPAIPPTAPAGAQGELFTPQDLAGLQRGAEPTPPAPPAAPTPAEPTGEQLGLGLEDQRKVEDLFLERERLKKEPQTPEVKARVKEVSNLIRAYLTTDYERVQQDIADQEALAAEDKKARKKFPALAEAPIIPRGQTEMFGEEETPIPEEPQQTLMGTPVQPKVIPIEPAPPKSIHQYRLPLRTVPEGKEVRRFPKPAKPVAPEPTMEAAPEAPKAGAITSQTLDDMGIQGKGVRGWFEKNVVGKTVEEVRAETEKNPALLQGKGERPQLLRELVAPKAEPFDVTQKITPPPAAQPQPEPGAGQPSISLPSKPAGAKPVQPRARRAAPAGKPTPPVGGRLADTGQPAVARDAEQGKQRGALVSDAEVRARLQAIIDNQAASKRSKQIAFAQLDILDDPDVNQTPQDRAYNIKEAEKQAISAEQLSKYSKAGPEVEGQTLDQLKADIANAKGPLGAALRRLVQSGKVKLAERHPSGKNVAGEFNGSTATLYADSIAPGRALSVAMHEVAAHLGLKKLLGAASYDALAKRIETLAETDPLAKRALDRVPQDIKDAGGEAYTDEVAAYYIEELANAEADGTLPKAGPVRNLWNQIKTAVVNGINRALGTSFGVNSFTPQQIKEIADAAFRKEAATPVETAAEAKQQFSISASTSSLVDSMGPLEPEDKSALTKLVDSFKLQGGVDYATTFRTQVADIGATIEARLRKDFDGAVRDSMGNVNPMGLYRQAQDYTKMLLEYFQRGAIAKDPNTKQWMVTDAKGIRPPVAVYNLIDAWGKKNGYSRERATQIASRVLEGVRLDQMRASNQRGETNFALHLKDPQIDQLVAEYNADPDLQEMNRLMDEARVALVDHLVQVGRLSAEEGKAWSEVIGYVPFDRVSEETLTNFRKIKKVSGKGLAHLGKLPELVGSIERPVGNVFDNYINTLGWMVGQIVKNDATVRTLRALEDIGEAKFLHGSTQGRPNTVGAYIDGEMKYWELPSKYDVMAFKDLNPPKAGWLLALGRFSNVLRKSVTILPPFALKQVTDDVQRAIVTSGVKNPGSLMWMALTNFPKLAVAELRGIQHPMVREFGALGLTGEYDFEAGKPAASLLKDLGYKPRGKFETVLHRLDGITRASDLAVRKAIYDQTMREEQDALLAQTRAREFINFRRRGASERIGALVTTIPFFNAYIQGMDVLYRAASGKDSSSSVGRAQARRMFWSRAATVFMLSSLYAMGKGDDEDYEEMDLRTRDSNWILPGGVKIAAPGELGAIFKVIPERIVEYMRRQGTPEEQTAWEATRTALTYMYEQYLGRVTPIPQAVKPIMEAWANKSFLTGRQLEGYHHQQMDPSMRRSEQTSELAVAIANFSRDTVGVEVSPIMVDNALRGYFGTSAALLTMTTDSLLNPTRVDRPLHKYALLSNYLYDPVGTRRVTEFYETRDSVGKAGATLRELMKSDVDRAVRYAEEHQDELMLEKAVNSTLNQLEKTRAYRKFLNSPDGAQAMSTEEREAQLNEIRKMEVDLTRWVREAKASLPR